jgi:hypothetical protein
MKKQADGIFPLLEWILQKPKQEFIFDEDKPSTFMLLRWLSMSSKENSKIVNETLNRWYSNYSFYNDTVTVSKFLKNLLHYHGKRLNYIKKKTTKKPKLQEETEEHLYRECSKKEVLQQKQLLEELRKLSK